MGLTIPTTDSFKDKIGRWRTKSLFREHRDNTYPYYFTLGEEDLTDCISLKRKYLEYEDPTEYIFATKVFGSFPCWERLLQSPEIKAEIDLWRHELKLKLEAKALANIKEIASDPSSSARLTANKIILDYTKDRRSAGRKPRRPVDPEDAATKHNPDDWQRLFGKPIPNATTQVPVSFL